MTIAQFVVSSFLVPISFLNWSSNWAWGVPLIVLTVVIHVCGLGFIKEKAFSIASRTRQRRHYTTASLIVIGGVTLAATVLHAIEASLWAGAYLLLGALTDPRAAVLYSLNAVTS
jgi:MFS superfamily sulfate permease-like transporter